MTPQNAAPRSPIPSPSAKKPAASAPSEPVELKAADPAAPRKGKVTDVYNLGKVIGSGSYSVVRVGVEKATNTQYAIKCIKRADLSAEDEEAILTEIAILKSMNHPHIMSLREYFVDADNYYLVTEFVSGGELFDRIVEKTYYSEKEARDLVHILLDTIKYCHDKGVVHRDLKPENLLLVSKDDDASIKLADFGFAKKVVVDDSGLVTTCGTPGYVAPEILEGESYGKPVDVWSVGIITYILLAGYPPFHDDSQPILFRKIRRGKFQFDSPYWDNVSDDAKDFIRRMLVVKPAERATAAELLTHRWITGEDVANVPLTSALTELRRFHARKKFRAAVLSVTTTISLNKAFGASGSSSSSSSSTIASLGESANGMERPKSTTNDNTAVSL
ncbi:hypothetical protein ATCC90586_007633 [Pythium insidiosum]|nr:hypothetical protein ATCC90586_007633 [Pythium insidiosum]